MAVTTADAASFGAATEARGSRPIAGLENHAEMIRALTEDREAIKVYVEVATAT